MYNLVCYASNTTPRLFRRTITGDGFGGKFLAVSKEDKEKLQSTAFMKMLDVVSEGPIEGFCDATGGLVQGAGILKGIYLNDTPVQLTTSDTSQAGIYNFRNISVAWKRGELDQTPFYVNQGESGETEDDNFYWLEDFSYASQTIGKNVPLGNQVELEENDDGQGKRITSQTTHSVMDEDVDWLGVTLNVDQCYTIDKAGEQQPNKGKVMIWGDITGITHRSLDDGVIEEIIPDGLNDYNVLVDIQGLSLSQYKEDIWLKLIDPKDLSGPRPRQIYIRNVTAQSYNFKSKFSVTLDSVTEIVDRNFNYPGSAMIASLVNAENFGNAPTRSFDMKLKRVKVPSNYVEKLENEKGPTNLRAYTSSYGSKGSSHTSEERHEGVWDGTFKEELEWTDNPAWILYDILTNDIYGLGEYIRDVNLDKWELFKIAKYCDELVPTSIPVDNSFKKERRFSCNLLLQNPADAYKTVNEICSIFRGIAYFNNLEIFISMNALKNSIFKFSNDSVLEGNFSYAGAPRQSKFTAVKVAYKDKEDSFLTKYEYVEDPEGITRYGWNLKEVTAVGCTSRDQALRTARWILLTSVLEEETVSFTTDSQAEHIEPGHIFTIYDELRNGFKVGGRVLEVVDDNPTPSKNYVFIDQKLDLTKKYTSISFLIPDEDVNLNESEHYIEFIHRNGQHQGASDGGQRDAEIIPINSERSANTNLNNYFEVTTSGTKILTHQNEDLIQRIPKEISFISSSAGYKTFNDYFLATNVLAGMPRGDERKSVSTKLKEGALYILHGEEADGSTEAFDSKEYQLLGKTENQDGTYSMIAMEYNREKFSQTDSLSTIYTARTVPYDPTPANRPSAGGGPLPQFDDDPDDNTQVQNLGAPEKNTIEVIIAATGYVNSEGVTRSRANYFIHNLEENEDYYNPDVTNFGNYFMRVQRITEEYYRSLVVTKMGNNDTNLLQNNEWKVPGLKQKCGSNKILWDLSLGADRDKARVGGSNNLTVSLPNYKDSKFTPFLEVAHPRYESEFDDLAIDGCAIFDADAYEARVTGAVSGEFELPDSNGYYELRWSEANDFGRSEEKVMFFRGEPDLIPPDPPDHFNVSLNPLFPNNLSFRWENESPDRELDLIGFRLYTGWVGGEVPEFENTNLGEEGAGGYNEYRLPKIGSSFTEVVGKYASHTVYEADTSRGSFADLNGNPLGIGTNAMFHIRAFDVAGNFSDPRNSNLISLFDVAVAPDLYLSGEIREEGKGTDTYRQSPILHAFYSGQFHNDKSFKKYFLKINDETFGVSNHSINIFQEDIKTAPAQYEAGASGHLEIREVTANTEYFGKLSAFTSENRESLVATSTAKIGKDNFAPLKIKNFEIRKQFSDFEFSWDPPPEADCNRVLLYTGVGKDNFGEVTVDQNKIIEIAKNKNGLIASVNKDDRPVFPISRFDDVIQYKNAATTYPFHILPVDTSDNTGVYTDAEFKTVDMSPPVLHTSGTVNEAGQGLVHVFYSGVAQDDSTFQYYLTEYKDINSFDIKTFQGKDKAAYNDSDTYGGSGHFVFEANGNTFYDVKTRIVLSKNETDWATDTILSNEIYDVVSDHVYVPRDSKPPGKLERFRVSKEWSNFRFSWDEPKENDVVKVLLYTGIGKENFDFTVEEEQSTTKIEDLPIDYSSPFASVLPDDAPSFAIDKFNKPGSESYENTKWYFHALAVDSSNNTGMYVDTSFEYVNLDGPVVHTSGEITSDGRSVIHVFYSGQEQNDDSFRYYFTEYQNVEEMTLLGQRDSTKAFHNPGVLGEGSGHYIFEAKGDSYYEVRVKSVFDIFQSNWADDTILTNKYYDIKPGYEDYIYAAPDNIPPGTPTWISSQKNGNNIFLSWENPGDHDLEHIHLYTGTDIATVSEDEYSFSDQKKVAIHQSTIAISDIIPLKDFSANAGKKFYFWLQAEDTSNNKGKISERRLVDVGRTEALFRDEVRCTTGIINDDGGDGTSYAFINYLINDDPLNRQHLSYTIQLSKRPSFNPLIGTQEIPVQYSDDDDDLKVRYPGRNIGSGIFSNLEANQTYYLRARINEHDGKQSQWTLSYDNPIKTPKDSTLPKIPNNFNIISGPKQIFLEWDWDQGISKDTDSILVYKTGIPTGIVKEDSVEPTLANPNTNCWKMSHISGYFFNNPELYTYKLSASTSYIDNDVETGINGESIYYFYFLRTLDKSDNLSKQFVSGISRDVHNYYPVNKAKTIFSNEANLAFGETPHTQGYVTGGAVSADYISNIYASRILTDRITAADFILSHPSGRVLSDNVFTRAVETPQYAYSIGKGVYLDHKMFRIGDPSPGGYGLFWTGHKEYSDSDFTKPTFSKDPDGFHAIDIDPNTLEIRGNLTAGTIEIGASRTSAFNVDSEGNLTIGNQTKEISGFFKGELGVSGIFGETYEGYDYDDQYSSVFVQIETDHLTAIEKAAIRPGVYLETNWKRGPFYYGWEIAQVESFNQSNGILKLELPGLEYNGFDFYNLFGNAYGLSGVTTTGSRDWDSNNVPVVRDYWRIHDAKFKVTKDGSLFAADAKILGTAKADALEVGQTIVLGDTYNSYSSVIQSYNFDDDFNPCDPTEDARGWKIVGDGTAYFKSIDIRSGLLSGSMGLIIGNGCYDNAFFRVTSKGDISIGRSLVYHNNPFYVSREGNLFAQDAEFRGDLNISGRVDVGDGMRFGSHVTRDRFGTVISATDEDGILINRFGLQSTNFQHGSDKGFQLTQNGKAILHNLAVTGGWISGANLLIGRGSRDNPWFKAFSNGDISLGDYAGAKWTTNGSLSTAATAPSKNHPFFVSRKGTLKTKDAYIIGDVGISGNVDVGDGIRFGSRVNRDEYGNVTSVTKDTNGILINSSAMRSINYQSVWDGTTKSFYLGADGETILSDLVVRGGNISGVKMMIGKGTSSEPWLKVWDDGEISIGSYGYSNRNRAPKNTDPFYVDKQGSMWAQNAFVKGTITGRYGRVGSLIMDPDWLSTSHPDYDVPRTSNNLQTVAAGAHNASTNPYRVGWYINSEGHFSVVNEAGKLFGWAGENQYLTVTGLASSSKDNAIYETTRHPSNYDPPDPNTYGKGFLLQGEHMGGWISNFRTDPKSAWGIANQVITCIHGDIRLPVLNDLYTIISNSPIGYFVSGIYLETDVDNATVRFTKNDPQAAVPSILGPENKYGNFTATKAGYYTTLSNTNKIEPGANKDSYLVAKPTSVGTNTSIRFRIDLYRQGSYTKNTADASW